MVVNGWPKMAITLIDSQHYGHGNLSLLRIATTHLDTAKAERKTATVMEEDKYPLLEHLQKLAAESAAKSKLLNELAAAETGLAKLELKKMAKQQLTCYEYCLKSIATLRKEWGLD